MDPAPSTFRMPEALSSLRSPHDDAIKKIESSLQRAEGGNASSTGAVYRALKNIKQQGTQFISVDSTAVPITWSEIDQEFQVKKGVVLAA